MDLKGPKNTKGAWLMLHGTWLLVHAIWLMLHRVWLLLHAPLGPALAFAARRVGDLAFGARALERAARMKKPTSLSA